MVQIEKGSAGSFAWVELATTDAAGAKAFYSGLFGYETHDDPVGEGMVYTMLLHGGRNAGALYEMNQAMRDMHIPPHWLLYVTVDDLEATVAKARSIGAAVPREPMDVMGIGRMAVLQDPSSAALALWQPLQSHGFQVAHEPSTFCWGELLTPDRELAVDFYTKLFGWTAKGEPPYTELKNGDDGIGGIFQMPPELDAPANWMAYFMAEDCEASTKRAVELGAQVMRPVEEIPHVGLFSVVRDPQGAAFALYEHRH